MKELKEPSLWAKCYADPELRGQMRKQREKYAAQAEARRVAAEEVERTRPERLEAFWQRLGLPEFAPSARAKRAPAEALDSERRRLLVMPVAEAWIKETEWLVLNAETCKTQKDLLPIILNERRRLKSVRRIFKELGIK